MSIRREVIMMGEYLLAIDNGTQSLRALVFDAAGNLIAKEQVTYQPYVAPQPGWAEQDPELYWSALCSACKRLFLRANIQKESLLGVSLTCQRGSVVNLDGNGKPLRPAILWLDQRASQNEKQLGGLWGLLFKLAGVGDTVAYLQAQAECNWLRSHQPDIWKRTEKFLLLSGFLNHRLTGRYVDSVSSQVGFLPFDYKKLCWASARDWRWDALAVRREMLPDLVPVGGELGKITVAASMATGLPLNLPVIAGAADKACEVLGAGSLDPSIGCLSYGTTATYNITTARFLEVIPFIPPYPAAIPDAYSAEVQIFRGYWMVEWFKQEFGHKEVSAAIAQGVPPERLLEELIAPIPAGCDGLVLQPYWSPGLKIPGPEARGAIIGFSEKHTRGHVFRAILEGLAFALREGKERVESRAKTAVTELHVSGGGSQSDTALQITANIFGLPTLRSHTYETSGLGAAMILAVSAGLHQDYKTAAREMTHTAAVFEPQEDNRRMYDELYQKVYCKLYQRVRPLYEALAKLRH